MPLPTEVISEVGKGEMKIISIAALLLITSTLCFGQAPAAALYNSNSDLYVGFMVTSPDYGPHLYSYHLKGLEAAYTRSLGTHLGVIGSGSYVRGTGYNVRQFSWTAGVKYSLFTGRFRPYATAQAGYARQYSTDGPGDNGFYGGDHHPPLAPGSRDIEAGLTYRFGGGLDARLSNHFYWRVLQLDIQPQPWARHTPWYWNFSSGVGYRF